MSKPQNKAWFNAKVKWRKPDIDGIESWTSELYVIEAYTYIEAEERINEIMAEIASGSFQLSSLTKTNIAEVHENWEHDLYFKVKLSMVAFDDETGKEKQSSFYMLVGAENVRDCYDETKNILKDSGTGYVIPSIVW